MAHGVHCELLTWHPQKAGGGGWGRQLVLGKDNQVGHFYDMLPGIS